MHASFSFLDRTHLLLEEEAKATTAPMCDMPARAPPSSLLSLHLLVALLFTAFASVESFVHTKLSFDGHVPLLQKSLLSALSASSELKAQGAKSKTPLDPASILCH